MNGRNGTATPHGDYAGTGQPFDKPQSRNDSEPKEPRASTGTVHPSNNREPSEPWTTKAKATRSPTHPTGMGNSAHTSRTPSIARSWRRPTTNKPTTSAIAYPAIAAQTPESALQTSLNPNMGPAATRPHPVRTRLGSCKRGCP